MNYTMPITNPILRRLYELMDERGTNAKRVTETLHLSGSSFTDWKKGKASPCVDALKKFSEYFGVSLDYLITGKEYERREPELAKLPEMAYERTEPACEWTESGMILAKVPERAYYLDANDRELIAKFQQLPAVCQEKTIIYVDGMLAAFVPGNAREAVPPVSQ